MNNDTIITMKYISIWGWFIIGIIFLTNAMTLVLLNKTVAGISFLFVFALCMFFAFKRKQDLEKYGD